MLKRIFGPKEEVVGGWRRLHNEELHNLSASPNIVRVMKPRRIGWEGHVAYTGEIRNSYNILVGKPERKRALGRNVKILLECTILWKQGGKVWTGYSWLRIGTSGRLF
jgi:hypothetical protein